jgi:23S rRNA pseudouridine2605 synthase
VGRLDRHTTGLLLLTNDGSFCQSIIHPTNAIIKAYSVTVSSTIDNKTLEHIRTGFFLDDGPVEFESFLLTDHNQIRLTIIEGRNRIIRRAFETLGFEVVHLKRIAIGGISLGKLKMGDVIPLTPKERQLIKDV